MRHGMWVQEGRWKRACQRQASIRHLPVCLPALWLRLPPSAGLLVLGLRALLSRLPSSPPQHARDACRGVCLRLRACVCRLGVYLRTRGSGPGAHKLWR